MTDILDMVDTTPRAEVAIPLGQRLTAEAAGKEAYFAARARGASADEARTIGQEATAKALLVNGAAPSPAEPARAHLDANAAQSAGFSVAMVAADIGGRVAVDEKKARRSRVVYDRKPLAREVCAGLMSTVTKENRRIEVVAVDDIGMDHEGRITGLDVASAITPGAFGSMTTRLGYGGKKYLMDSPVALRAYNVNYWRGRIHRQELEAHDARVEAARKKHESVTYSPKTVAFRVRDRVSTSGDITPEIFAAVSEGYTAYDGGGKIAEAIYQACSGEQSIEIDGRKTTVDLSTAKGSATYNGERTRIEVLFHTDVRPKDFTAGEIFQAGAKVTTSDVGGGSAKGFAVVWQHKCANMMMISRKAQELFSIRHVGSVEEMAKQFNKGFRSALKAIEHFLVVWGYACREDAASTTATAYKGVLTGEKALPGIFRGILDQGLVKIPRSRYTSTRETTVAELMRCWMEDDSSATVQSPTSRAAIVNAITRLAHEVDFEDPYAEDEIERDASRLLWGNGNNAPDPLPYCLEEIEVGTSVEAYS